MGIIKKQSISGAAYSYAGVALGFIISGLLFPKILSTSEIGLLRLLVSYSILLAQFALLGMNTVTIKIFPYFRNKEKKHHGFLGLLLIVTLLGFILTTAIYLLGQNIIISDAKAKSELFIPYYYYVIPIFFFTLLFNVFDSYYRVLYNATIGILYKEIIQRIIIIASIVLFYFKIIDFHFLVVLYAIAQLIPGLFLFLSLIYEKQLFLKPDFKFLNKSLVNHMISVAFFGIITAYSGVLIMNIDLVMINHYLGLSSTGIYSITFFFGTLIIIPARALSKITAVVIADFWKNNDTKGILDIYKKSTSLLVIAASFIFVGIWANIDNVFKIIGPNYESGKYVILFIGLANVIDAFSGSSSLIIANSNKYRWLSIFLIIYTVAIIITNIIFIPVMGIAGAAFASFISRLIYVLLRFIFLNRIYHFQPYSYKHLLIVIIAVATWYLSTFIPTINNFLIDILVRSISVTIVYIFLIFYANISDDFNKTFLNVFSKIIKINKQ